MGNKKQQMKKLLLYGVKKIEQKIVCGLRKKNIPKNIPTQP